MRVEVGAALAALLGIVPLAPAPAAAQSPVAEGGCRDGLPNGAYELRTREGKVQVTGAFARGRRTATFLFWSPAGARIAAIPYDEDARAGTVALWHPPANGRGEPQRRLEAAYAGNVLHGPKRSWHPNGNPRTELRYHRGQLVDAQAWSEAGAPLPEGGARAEAERDAAIDEELVAALETIVAQNRPPCANHGR
jgi:antitoxin component YwqK of YwqJK toxin-antitoxin module